MSYLETLFSQECPSIFKQYQAEFTKHGFDTPSTIKLLCYDDLLQKIQVRDFRRNFESSTRLYVSNKQMKVGEARAVWSVLVKKGICHASKCPLCAQSITSSALLVKSAQDMKHALPPPPKTTSSTKVNDDDPNAHLQTVNTSAAPKVSAPSSIFKNFSSSKLFMYQSDFDGLGIVHELMRGCTLSGPYPITATSSSLATGNVYGPLFNSSGTCCTTNKMANSWWKFDFGNNRRIDPVKYTLKHGFTQGKHVLFSWNLEGSNDDSNWIVRNNIRATRERECQLCHSLTYS